MFEMLTVLADGAEAAGVGVGVSLTVGLAPQPAPNRASAMTKLPEDTKMDLRIEMGLRMRVF